MPSTVERSRRDKALREIIAKIREKPVSRKDFPEMPERTYYKNMGRAIYLKVARKLSDGCLAWIDYEPSQESIENAFWKYALETVSDKADPPIEWVAKVVGRRPSDPTFEDEFYKFHKTWWNERMPLAQRIESYIVDYVSKFRKRPSREEIAKELQRPVDVTFEKALDLASKRAYGNIRVQEWLKAEKSDGSSQQEAAI
jgi:hypothetical protein